MDKIFFEYKDYLPEGWTFEKIEKLIEAKQGQPLTREALAEIIDPKYLDMTEEEFLDHLAKYEEVLPKYNLGANQPRMAYAENLEKDDELNQDFPNPED